MSPRVMDPERLEVVASTGLVDSEREAVFDQLTLAAAQLLNAPFAFMTVVDDERSYWKSAFGIVDGTRANTVSDSFCQYVVETDRELILDDVTANPMTQDNPSIESMGVRAWAGYPLLYEGQVLGTFCVVDQVVREWTDQDREILQTLARSAAREIEHKSSLDAAVDATRRMSEVLDVVRHSLLPPTLPDVPNVDIAAWFRAADDGDLLLGDFYDVFPLPGSTWGFVIGDVCGHGAEAARLTSLLRYTLRAAATHHADPAAALAQVDAALLADRTELGRYSTASYLTIDLALDADNALLARAGHPHAIVRSPDGACRLVGEGLGPPLGAVEGATYEAETFSLRPGETIVMYTDGVTESRTDDNGALLTEQGLIDIIESAPAGCDADELMTCISDSVAARSTTFTDDIAVVVIGLEVN